MTDEKGPVEELSEEGLKVVVAGSAALWPNKKLMLAVLPPTLALLIAVVGVWESSNRDRAAAAQAEQDRVAAAEEAEKVRAAEVARDQAEAEKERQLREAQLVLPRYEGLLTEVRIFTNTADICREDLEDWLGTEQTGWPRPSVGTAATAVEGLDGELIAGEAVALDQPFLTSCRGFSTLDALQQSVDRALVISNPDLQDAASKLEGLLIEVDRVADHLSEAPLALDSSDQLLVIESVDLEGLDFRQNVERLSDLLTDADAAIDELIDVVRGVLLPED